MRYLSIILLFLGLQGLSYGQNLVPNPSFEEVNHKPMSMLDSGHEFARDCKSWSTPNLASTDLITSRFKTNKFDPIIPYHGENMAGIVIHGDFWSEYLKVKLQEPTQAGTEYYVEFWIAYCNDYHKDDKKKYTNPYLGAHFGNDFFIKDEKQLKLENHIGLNQKIELKDKVWTKVHGSFIAQDKFEYLYIGQFANPSNPSDFLLGYYFIDEVKVVKFSDKSTVFSPKQFAPDGLNNIYFETDKYELLTHSFSTLDKVVVYLKKNQSLKVSIEGHTDSRGENYHNNELSQNRAKAVYDYLVQKGIPKNRLAWAGKGSRNPIASNDNEAGRQENRRVEFIASGTKIVKQSLSEVDIAEADHSYNFSSKLSGYKYNFIGKYNKLWNCANDQTPKGKYNPLKEYQVKEAKEYLKPKAKEHEITFLNDSPLYPQTRIFARSILKDYWDAGYRFLGVEAFTNLGENYTQYNFPSINAGQLTDEPLFGELVREAIKLGYTLFSFQPSAQEILKANNIIRKTGKETKLKKVEAANWAKAMNINRKMIKSDEGKYLIYCNKNQVSKKTPGTLTYWFEQITKKKVYVIDQVTMNEHCPKTEHPVYKYAKTSKPSVYLKYKTPFIAKEDEIENPFDIQVFHPRTQYIQNRPDWLRMKGARIPFVLNPDQYEMEFPLLVAAYLQNEDRQIAVPIDVVEFEDNKTAMPLLLPKGKYSLILRDQKTRKKVDISVD